MNPTTSPPAPLVQEPAATPAAATSIRLENLGYRLGGLLAPTLAGRVAAQAFGRSRSKGGRTVFRMPLGAQAFDIAGNDDVKQGYLWKNSGPTILLVHGWGSDSSSMTGFVRPLHSLGFQVASLDAPAHGASAGTNTTMTRFVGAVGAALRALGNVQVIIGHSLGSIAAVAAVAKAEPALAAAVRSLVLLAAPASLSTVLDRWSTSDQRKLPPNVIQKVYERLHVQNGVPVSHWDICTLGASLQIPVLVLHDEHDPVVPLCEAQKLGRALQNVRLEKTRGLGHSRVLSAAPVKDLVTQFISDLNLLADQEASS